MTPQSKRKLTLALNAYGRACIRIGEGPLCADPKDLRDKSRRKSRLYAVVDEILSHPHRRKSGKTSTPGARGVGK